MAILLELQDIKKYFSSSLAPGKVVRAVDGVDLFLEEGENLGLVGESGSGKTTLGRIILKLYRPDSGKMFFEGKNWTELSAGQARGLRRNLQMVFQDPYQSLDPRYRIEGILNESFIAWEKEAGISRKEKKQRMQETLKAVGLDESALRRFPHEFSGGERQRIAISRALLTNPKLLVLDEAVSSLDVLIQAQILDLLRDLQRKFAATYLFITHNLRVVRKLCPKIAVMYQGKIVEYGPTEMIFSQPLHPYTKELLEAALEYRPPLEENCFVIPQDSRLRDRGNGHFVID